MNTPACRQAVRLPYSQTDSGSSLVIVMILTTVLTVVAANLLLTAVSRYHTTYQSASWQESVISAEAGVDLAMNELRKRVVQGPSASFHTGWTQKNAAGAYYADYGHAFPTGSSPYTLANHGGEGNTNLQARVYVDVPGADAVPMANFAVVPPDASSSFISTVDNPSLADPDGIDRSRWWYRIRSLGIASLSGPAQSNIDSRDNHLRHFSFFTDWRTGRGVSAPETARMVEVLVRPQTNFRNAIMADVQINLSNQDVLIDSYDSSKGNYDSTSNHGTMGNIATNGKLINANNATVQGDALTNNGTVKAGDNVTGQQSSNFYQELTPLSATMLNPAWSSIKSGGTLVANANYTASLDPSNPTTVKLDGIALPDGGKVVSFDAPSSGSGGSSSSTPPPSFVKVYVQGDVSTAGTSYINVAAGVNAIFYVAGNVNIQGNGILNDSFVPSRLVLNGVQPTPNKDGTTPPRSITIATWQDFQGIIYAPNHDLDLALQAVPTSTGILAPILGPILGGPPPPPALPGPPGAVAAPAPPSPVQNQITALENKAVNFDNDAANKLNDYNNRMADYAKNGSPGSLKQAQKDQQDIAADQQQAAALRAQEAILAGVNTQAGYDDHVRGYNGIYGGFVARTVTVENKTHLHYDETLRSAGPVNHYEVVNWFEDNLGRDQSGGAERFWW